MFAEIRSSRNAEMRVLSSSAVMRVCDDESLVGRRVSSVRLDFRGCNHNVLMPAACQSRCHTGKLRAPTSLFQFFGALGLASLPRDERR